MPPLNALLTPRLTRKIHRTLVPLVMLPLLLTIATGVFYQMAILTKNAGDFYWLMELHRGKFGILNLGAVYPFLNALGLLVMAITGGLLWWGNSRRR